MESRRRVLVAEDNPTDRMLLRSMLQQQGFAVIEAADGAEALTSFAKTTPDLVLLDALMPGADGFEVATRIRADYPDLFVPIIFLTSLQDPAQLARCLQAGGDDFLSKPFNQVILSAKIDALERMRQLHLTVQAQRDQIQMHHQRLVKEQDAAKQIFDRIAHKGCINASNIKYLISPKAIFNGDVLLAALNPAGNMYVFLGDFTGHGLPASMGAIPLSEIFYGMTRKGFSMVDVLREINARLRTILPTGYFCCGAMAHLDFNKGSAELWNAGLPDIYIRRCAANSLQRIASSHLPLGLAEPANFQVQTQVYRLAPDDWLFMCTDGVLEARSLDQEMFGVRRLEQTLLGSEDSEQAQLNMEVQLGLHTQGQALEDDLSIVQLSMQRPSQLPNDELVLPVGGLPGSRDWQLSYELRDETLKHFDPLPMLRQIILELPELRPRSAQLFAVIAELYANALEHGVLGLSSMTKLTPSGFAEYYRDRASALAALKKGSIRFEMKSASDAEGGMLYLRVTDSGRGFDHKSLLSAGAGLAALPHGRGLHLVAEFCDVLRFQGAGNIVEAEWVWRGNDG